MNNIENNQNEVNTNPVVNKEENNQNNQKSNNVVVICITLVVIAIIAAVVVIVLNKPKSKKETSDKGNTNNQTTTDTKDKQVVDDNTNNSNTNQGTTDNKSESTKIDDTKGLYYINNGNEYRVYEKDDKNQHVMISYSYPIINSKDENATKINNDVKKIYEDSEKNLLSNNTQDGFTCVYIDNKEKCSRTVSYIKYSVIETETIINIQITEYYINYHGSGSFKLINSYFISKTDGKVLNNSEVIGMFNYSNDKLVSAYNNYSNDLKSNHGNYFDKYNNVSSVDELTLALSNEQKFSIYGPVYGPAPEYYLNYDGTKVFNPNEK